MSYEDSIGSGVESMQVPEQTAVQEAVDKREHLYVRATLENTFGCGDDRYLEEFAVQMFGGVGFVTYNRSVVMEVTQPGSTNNLRFDHEIKSDVRELKALGIKAAVHSDDNTEAGAEFRTELKDGSLGCAYINLRQQISKKIYDEGEDIVATIALRQPDLFETPEDYDFAHQIIKAHGRLSGNDDYFKAGGRAVAISAAEEGAPTLVVEGQHAVTADGIINTKPGTTLDTKQAVREELPAYNHDQWAVDAINERKSVTNKRLQKLAELIDVEGVFRALDVKVVGLR